MKINVTHNGSDIFMGQTGKRIAVNAITVDVDGKKYKLPKPLPNRIELTYSANSRVNLDNSIIQSVHRISHISQIRQVIERTKITNQLSAIIQRNPRTIVIFHLQFPQDNILTKSDRELIHEIQVNAGASIITDYELSRNQNEDKFEQDIQQLRKDYPKHVICPTVDIGMYPQDLLAKKLDKIFSNGFRLFNVVYRSMEENRANWLDLAMKLLDNKVWCNVVGVTPRWQRKNKASNLARVFHYGVHTASLGYPWIGSVDVPANVLNGNTMCYELVRGMAYSKSRVVSINTQQKQLVLARRHIIGKTYFTKYVPARIGLLSHVRSAVA